MADYLTTSGINSLVNSFYNNEVSKKITPLNTKIDKYQSISSAYSTLNTSLTSFKSILSSLKATGSSSVFASKTTTSSNSDYATVTATSSAATSSYNLHINQLAKSDMVLGMDLTSNDYSTSITTAGTHSITIKTGDGEGGEYYSNIDVTFSEDDFDANGITNKAVMQAIADAVNSDKAVVTSTAKAGTDAYTGGASSFTIDVGGTETTVTIDSATDYNDLISQLSSQINSEVSGVKAETVTDGSGNVQLKLTVKDSTNYISISNDSGYDLVSDLGIGVTKEMGGSGLIVASVFSPTSSTTQLSFTSANSGYNYRITELSDTGGSNIALNSVGLNLGTSRPTFVQNSTGTDTAGFTYDLESLNSKFTFNGVDIERDSNNVTDLVTGATISLKSVMSSTEDNVSISISNNVSAIKSKIESFIEKFNDVYSYIKSQQETDSDGNRGIFRSDANASSIMSMLTGVAYGAVSGISTDNINTLSKLGITFNSDTGLVVEDSSELEQVISENVGEVEALFNSSNGIAATLYTKVSQYLGSGGYLTKAKASVDDNVNELNDKVDTMQERIDKRTEALREQYIQMQLQLSSLYNVYNSISSSLS